MHDGWPTGSSIGGVIARLRVASLRVPDTSDEPRAIDRRAPTALKTSSHQRLLWKLEMYGRAER